MLQLFWCFRLSVSLLFLCVGASRSDDRRADVEESYKSEEKTDEHCKDKCEMSPKIIDREAVILTRETISECSSQCQPFSCDDDVTYSKYRTIDGSCNNLKNPTWGKSDNCLRRILPHDYGDGISEPRQSCLGTELPNARKISNVLHEQKKNSKGNFTIHFMEWGQFLAYDLSRNHFFGTAETKGNFPITCCRPHPIVSDKCIAVKVPPNDPFYLDHNVTCIDFPRSQPCPLCTKGQRQHWNQNTAYHDASVVYGSNEQVAKSLRLKRHGMLRTQNVPNVGPLLPATPISERCVSYNPNKSCFLGGDTRTNENVFLTYEHIVFVRYHNILCHELMKINPDWDDDQLYEEARRILIAQMQMITFDHYLKHVIGPDIVKRAGLKVSSSSSNTEYDPKLDATIDDEFTSAAFRFGHSMVPNTFSEIDPVTGHATTGYLRNYYSRPELFYEGQYDKMAFGMARDHHMKVDVELGDDVRDFLYRYRTPDGLDLAAVNIVRGRDHGIPGYTNYLNYFFNYNVTSFCDLTKYIPEDQIKSLQKLYSSVHDIDLYSGGLAEYPVQGGIVGPTFAGILRLQFRRLKFGDRFYFEHGDETGSFSTAQLRELKKTKLSRIICQTSKIRKIQEDIFLPPSPSNPILPCDMISSPNLRHWKD